MDICEQKLHMSAEAGMTAGLAAQLKDVACSPVFCSTTQGGLPLLPLLRVNVHALPQIYCRPCENVSSHAAL